jgi:hypothetical protein
VFEIVSNAWLSAGLGPGYRAIGRSASKGDTESLPDVHFFVKAIVMFAFSLLFLRPRGALLYTTVMRPFTTAVSCR